jgi:hypothetical protein
MAATATTWFYRSPEKDAYLLAERVNGTFWDYRFGGVLLHVTRAQPPFAMQGAYNGAAMGLEWEPNKWLRLTTLPASPALAQGVANIIRRPPSLRYETLEGETVWEWWVEGADKRWQELQGKAAYHSPARLDQDNA